MSFIFTCEVKNMYISFVALPLMKYIEDIQMFLLNMAFISPSEVENIYLS